MDTRDVIIEQARLIAEGRSHAVVTIVHADGSTPRESGKLIALPGGESIGSIGGGAVERLAIEEALRRLAANQNALVHYDMAEANAGTGMVCGGSMSVFIESFQPRPLLVMCGGGHVGLAVLKLAGFLGYDTLLLDVRRDTAPAAVPAGRYVEISDYRAELTAMELPAGAYYVIATPGHAQDKEALAAALVKQGAYTGMIGSRKKAAAVMEALAREGFPKEALSAVHAPIGLDLGGETPEEIALAIMAEVQAARYGGSCGSLSAKGP